MKREDFIEVDNEKYLDFVNKIIENNGRCGIDIIGFGCESCPFDESNNPDGIHCVDSGLSDIKISTQNPDGIMLNSAIKFRNLYNSTNNKLTNKYYLVAYTINGEVKSQILGNDKEEPITLFVIERIRLRLCRELENDDIQILSVIGLSE